MRCLDTFSVRNKPKPHFRGQKGPPLHAYLRSRDFCNVLDLCPGHWVLPTPAFVPPTPPSSGDCTPLGCLPLPHAQITCFEWVQRWSCVPSLLGLTHRVGGDHVTCIGPIRATPGIFACKTGNEPSLASTAAMRAGEGHKVAANPVFITAS
jgi:hypothetical protein